MHSQDLATGEHLAFGHVLRHYRVAAGLTQEELAERARLSVRAISDLERGARRAPYRETVQQLVAALHLSAQEASALERARRHGRTAAPPPAVVGRAPQAGEPGTRPAGANTGAGVLAALPTGRPSLVGRTSELVLLERHLQGTGPPVLLLAGEPGIGKTRLLQTVAQQASAQGWGVLAGGCHRRGGQEPYAPLIDALAQHLHAWLPARQRAALEGCAWLVRLLPELADLLEPLPPGALAPEQERRLLFAAVARFLANVAGPAGTLLVLDDLQWAGPDALDLLASLVRPVSQHRATASHRVAAPGGTGGLRVVGAYRDTEVRPGDPLGLLRADLAQAGGMRHQELGPLAPAEAEELLADLLAGTPAEAAQSTTRVLERAGGTPFYLVSYAQALRADGAGDGAGAGVAGEGQGRGDAIPWDVAQNVRQRVALLPSSAQELLGAAAVVGRRAPWALLMAVSGQPEDLVLAGLEAAERARLLLEDGSTYVFAHDLIREVVEADLGAARRAVLHRRVAQELEAQTGTSPGGPPLEALAFHYGQSGDGAKAVQYLELAGDQAQAAAALAAAEAHFRALLAHLEALGRPHDTARAQEKRGGVLVTMARYNVALEALEQAAALYHDAGDVAGVARVMTHIAQVHDQQGRPEEGVRRLELLLEPLEASGAAGSLALLYTTLARLRRHTGRFSGSLAAAEQAAALARRLGDERLLAEATEVRGNALFALGRVAEALDALEEARRRADAAGDHATVQEALSHAADVYYDQGQFAAARRCIEEALQSAEVRGDLAGIAAQVSERGHIATCMGEWERGLADLAQAVTLSRAIGASRTLTWALLNLGRHHLHTGAWEEASGYLEESLTLAERSGDVNMVRWVHSILAERDLLAGEAAMARARLAPLVAAADPAEQDVTWLLPLLAWAHLGLDEVHAARELVTRAVAQARERVGRLDLVEALWVLSLVALRQRRWAEATRSLEEGLELARAMPYPYAEARLLHVGGQLHRGKGELDAAREWLAAALALFCRLGARWDAVQVEQDAAQVEQAVASPARHPDPLQYPSPAHTRP